MSQYKTTSLEYLSCEQATSVCGEVTDVVISAKVLGTLLPKFDHVVAAIEQLKNLDKLTIDELSGSLLTHEVRIN